MAYSKQTWHDEPTEDTPISAARLGHIEDGIEAAASTADSASATAAAHTTALAGKQPLDADLTAVAALDSTAAGVIASDGAGWVSKTYTALKTALGLVKADVGLGNVDNTADTAKPVSTAQQTALNLKADLTSPALTGNPTAPTQTAGNNSTRVATTAFVATAVSGTSTPVVPAWADATAYALGALVSSGGQVYRATTAHTSSGSIDLTKFTAVAGTSLTPTATKTGAYTVAVGELAMMNVAGGGTPLTLPAAPADKALVGYRAIGATTAVPLVVNRGGSDTIGTSGATSASIPLADEVAILQYDAANTRWLAVGNVKTQASLDTRYLTVTASTQTGTTYTLALTDAATVVRCTNASAVTLTVPPNSSVAFPIGTVVNVYSTGAGGVTIAAGAGVTLRNNSAALSQYGEVSLRKDGTDEWVRLG